MVIEITTFVLRSDVDESAFLRDDERLQHALHTHPGLVRRTTARGANGEWSVITLWHTDGLADDAATTHASPVGAFRAHIDEASVRTRRYESLD